MKVHFIGDVGGNKLDYKLIVNIVQNEGHELITNHSITRTIDDIEVEAPEDAELYAKKMIQWIKRADVVIVETTISLLGAGYEISVALQLSKPVIVLYRPNGKNKPYVLKGVSSDKLQIIGYNDKNIKEVLAVSLNYAVELVDTRFTFLISPEIESYLDWVAKERHIPRSVFIRGLIENYKKEDSGYLKSNK